MEYALPIVIIVLFLILELVLTKKPRSHFVKMLSKDELNNISNENAQNSNANFKTNGKDYSVKKFLRTINQTKRKIKSQKDDEIAGEYFTEFEKTVNSLENKLKLLKKADFLLMSDLIGDKCSRIENILRMILESDNFSFDDNRAKIVFENFNKIKTITYVEIKNANLMKDYICLEKLYFLSNEILSILKIKKYAERATVYSTLFEKTKKFQWLKKNSIFLKFAHFEKFGETQNFCLLKENSKIAFFEKIRILQNIKNSLSVDFDFSAYYLPLDLLNHFEVFRESSAVSKENFLMELSSQASKINIDEYAFSFSLSKYAIQNHSEIQSKSLNFLDNNYIFYKSKSDMKILKNALVSKELMSLTFGKINKSILKNHIFENTFAHFSRSYPINLGILRHNERDVEICPTLPDFVKSLSFDFENEGILHSVSISKSDDDEKHLKVNGTTMTGVSVIRLSDKPLKIEIKTKV